MVINNMTSFAMKEAFKRNDEIAAMATTHSDRFVGLGILPMHNVDVAEELERSKDLASVTIKDHIIGHTLDEGQFLPLGGCGAPSAVVEVHQGDTIVARDTVLPRNTVGNLVEGAHLRRTRAGRMWTSFRS
jgi:hypothetical protein